MFLYRDPVKSIKSAFWASNHLRNIKLSGSVSLRNVCETNTDLFKIENFYNNYMERVNNNYPIYAIKYEDLFNRIEELDKVLIIKYDKMPRLLII